MQYKASKLFTAHLVSLIVMQELQVKKDDNNEIQREYHKLKKEQIDEKAWSVYSEVDNYMQRKGPSFKPETKAHPIGSVLFL